MRTPSHHFSHTPPAAFRKALAETLVAGPWDEDGLFHRAESIVRRPGRWLRGLCRRLLAQLGSTSRPTAAAVANRLATDLGLSAASAKSPPVLRFDRLPPAEMWPARGAPEGWDLPPLCTLGELGEWMGLTSGELDAFADLQGRAPRSPSGPLRNYAYVWRTKRSGSSRLIEAPKPRLKSVQRRILDGILSAIPPHEAAHGFRKCRGVGTFVAPHVGRNVVLRIDLRDFFPSVNSGRVVALFLTAGYPEPVARTLAGICTTRTPRDVWNMEGAQTLSPQESWRVRQRFRTPHLPQGAPTSPALANLAAFRLDARLSAIAGSIGARYTRYADDLAFSGGEELARGWRRLVVTVSAVAMEEGFEVNSRKTRVMRRSVRQELAGVVVNERPNLARDEFDRLKAILHNAARTGPTAQNRDGHPDFRAHLTGRVAHVASIHPERGSKLRALLDAIPW